MLSGFKNIIILNKSLQNSLRRPFFFRKKNKTDDSPQNDITKQGDTGRDDGKVEKSEFSEKDKKELVNPDNYDKQVASYQTEKYQKQVMMNSYWPTFDKLSVDFLQSHTQFSMENQIFSPFRWTPLIQKRPLSPEFIAQMRRFAKKRYITDEDRKELVDVFLFEAIKDTEFDYYYDYHCKPSAKCKFHGKADFLIYSKQKPHVPFVPVIMARRYHNIITNSKDYNFNISEAVGAGSWALSNMRAADSKIQNARVIHTNGNLWRMYELRNDGEFRKTGYYTPQCDPYHKIYYDEEMQRVVLGLIRFSCDILTYEERELRKIMDFVDEKKYLTELDPETKEKLEGRKRTWSKFLPRSIHNLFF